MKSIRYSITILLLIAVLTAVTFAAGFPVTVKDSLGSDVTIAKKPVRIVSLSLGTDEILLSLVDAKRIASVTTFATDPSISNVAEEVKKIPVKTNADLEKVINLQPDLVLVANWTQASFIQQLRDLGIPVYAFAAPGNVTEIQNLIGTLGKLVGEEAKAKKLVASMDKKLAEITAKIKKLKPGQQLSVREYNTSYASTSGKGTNFDDLVARAGLINVASKAGLEGWPQVSKEKIIEMNPDIIFLYDWIYDKGKDQETYAGELLNDASLASVNAIKNKRVHLLSGRLATCLSHYIVDGIEEAAKIAYPELFKK